MDIDFEKNYEPSKFEQKQYERWEDDGLFRANSSSKKPPYCIVMPPPNITGQLHMGHALDNTLQDILIRFKRMNGFEALWVPGVDHAAIATEVKIIEKLREEGLSKEEIGREEFLKRAWEWKNTYETRIVNQIKRLGASCDWTRKRFTMDDGCCAAVLEFFVDLFNEGLIYRGERTINWCVNCKTSLSDAEVNHEPEDGFLYYIKYFFEDREEYLTVATTRPETIFGDVAVAVNEKDPRFKDYGGKKLMVPLVGRKVPIIFDEHVDFEFGTGALKITPAHDHDDFEIGERHGLEVINIFDDEAKLNENCGKYFKLDRFKAREEVVKDLEKSGLIEKIEPYSHNVGRCYRCSEVIEPRISTQWFVKMKDLAERAVDVVKNGEVSFIPSHFEKVYFNWMENIKDWCISRQLWWGHKIPAYYCENCGEMVVSKIEPKICGKCSCESFKQDEDTLDTWFSSALWPFSTLGWPEKSEDFDFFYPTSVLVTGYDIIFFWVARMIFSALKNTGKPPFRKVFVHGLVRDEKGRKMSKSLGNGIDPLKVIEEYGADALRFTLASGTNAGSDMRYSEEKIKASRNFANKLWNASRFVALNCSNDSEFKNLDLPNELTIEDRWILTKLNMVVKEVSGNIENFEISVASQKIYDFVWNVFCDWFIELSKLRLKDDVLRVDVLKVLNFVLVNCLKLLHPFLPFITEEIFSKMPFGEGKLAGITWPKFDENLNFVDDCENFEKIILAVKAVRNLRAEMDIPKSVKTEVFVETRFREVFEENMKIFEAFSFAKEVGFVDGFNEEMASKYSVAVTSFARIFVLTSGLKDDAKEKNKLLKEKELFEKEVLALEKKLSNEDFLKKAPAAVVKKDRERLEGARQKFSSAVRSLEELFGNDV